MQRFQAEIDAKPLPNRIVTMVRIIMSKSTKYYSVSCAAIAATLVLVWPVVDMFHGYYGVVAVVGCLVAAVLAIYAAVWKSREH